MLTVILGLVVASQILPLMYPPQGGEALIAPIAGDPQSLEATSTLFFYILFMTAVVLVLMRRKLMIFVKAAVFMSFFTGTFLATTSIFGDVGLLVTFLLLLLFLLRRTMVLTHILLVLALSGVGALLGASLGVVPAIALVVLMSVYDFVAVFVTKHMVALAEGAKDGVPLMFSIPVGKRTLGLGAGDIAIPTAFTVSIYAAHGAGYALPTLFGGLLGLVSLFYYIMGRKNVTLPALPPIVAGLLIGYGLCVLILG